MNPTMAIHPKLTPIMFLFITLTGIFTSSDAGIVSDLLTLRSQFPSGVTHINDTLLRRITTSGPRSFYLVIFFDAIQLHNKPELNLKTIKSEFYLISQSFLTNNKNSSKIFFCNMEFGESEQSFLRFGVTALPNIRILPPDANDLKSESDSIPMEAGDYSGLAESMADFIESRTKLTIGQIHRPPILSKTQLGFLIAGFLIWMPFMAKKLIAGDTLLHSKRVWIFGTVFVYFFSVSGFMFNMIRRMPMVATHRKDPNHLMFFYKGHGMQFGAEGICIGFLFTLVGLLLASITHCMVRMKDSMVQRAGMITALIVAFWAVTKVVSLNHWKTGYAVHAYLPSSWYK